MDEISLVSPMAGWVRPLADACDPAFAQALLGDGILLEPMDRLLRAPCDGTVLTLNDSRHAVVIRTAEGCEILLHVGIDTVALKGEGFNARVAVGDAVTCGTPLLEFDLDLLAERATSLQTPIVLLNGRRFAIADRAEGVLVAPGDPILRIRPVAGEDEGDASGAAAVRRTVRVPLRHGLHARPAARVAAAARESGTPIHIRHGGRRCNAASPSAIMTLGVGHGDEIVIAAESEAGAAAVDRIADMIADGMGEAAPFEAVRADRDGARPLAVPADASLRGVTANPGIAAGILRQGRAATSPLRVDGEGIGIETERLSGALAGVRRDVRALIDAAPGSTAAEIAEAHLALIDDPELVGAAMALVEAGRGAGHAWHRTLTEQAARMRRSGNPRMADRAADIEELERRVSARIAGEDREDRVEPGAIYCLDDIGPSAMAALAAAGVAGVVTARGGPTSHAAIIAADLDIPFLVAAGPAALAVADGMTVILDAGAGELRIAPPREDIEHIAASIAETERRRSVARQSAHLPARTRDGVDIHAFANLGSRDEALRAVAAGAEGCGLLRTEFLFLDRTAAPDEAEQEAAYRAIAAALGDRPLILRLLDIGGDKPASYLPGRAEDNPALGLRGIRLGLAEPGLLETQIRAALRAVPPDRLHIMVPMISTVDELLQVRAMIDACARSLGLAAGPAVGVMIETPAAAVMADRLAPHCAFLSIGSNDLAQYVLARDRGNSAVAAGLDALDPAVIRCIDMTVRGAAGQPCRVGLCGGLASERLAIPLLIGLGLTELSSAVAMVAEVKQIVRAVRLSGCRDLAGRALRCADRHEVRALCAAFLEGVRE